MFSSLNLLSVVVTSEEAPRNEPPASWVQRFAKPRPVPVPVRVDGKR